MDECSLQSDMHFLAMTIYCDWYPEREIHRPTLIFVHNRVMWNTNFWIRLL